jgi:hypothetical protein
MRTSVAVASWAISANGKWIVVNDRSVAGMLVWPVAVMAEQVARASAGNRAA